MKNKIKKMDKSLVEFSSIIEDSVKGVSTAVHEMRNMKNAKLIFKACVEINSLENEGDKLRDEMLEKLFDTEKDPIVLMKWKEIYQL